MTSPAPRPGEHLGGPTADFADPTHVRDQVAQLVERVTAAGDPPANAADELAALQAQGRLLDQAHEVLAQALSTVDRV